MADLKGKPLKSANLPQKAVTTVVLGERYENTRQALLSYGINVLSVKENNVLHKAVSSHADMLFCDLGFGECFVENTKSEFAENLRETGFNVYSISSELQKDYPHDVYLNCVVTDNFALVSPHSESLILSKASERNIPIIKVRQGYIKCSVCIVSPNALITSDAGIAEKCSRENIDVLKISSGFIELPGYDYGFIGGCSGLLSPDTLCFTGDVKTHPDYDNIISFCRNYGVYTLSLSKKGSVLSDIGSVLPLLENE